jgi:phospholipase C
LLCWKIVLMCSWGVLVCGVSAGGAAGSGHGAEPQMAAVPQSLFPISPHFTDLKNGTLPDVAQIEPTSSAGLDGHGSDSDQYPINIQLGARYVSSLIDAWMSSTSWKDSAFILALDEGGGLYDHVPAQPALSPDGIKPKDLLPGAFAP